MLSEWLPWANVILSAMYAGLALNYIATHRRNPRAGVIVVTLLFVVYVGLGYALVALGMHSHATILVYYLAPMISVLLAAFIANLMVKR